MNLSRGLENKAHLKYVYKLRKTFYLDQEIYMNQSRGLENKIHLKYVYKLIKAFYVLKQASRTWYGKIAEFLTQSGYLVAHANSSLFVKASEGK